VNKKLVYGVGINDAGYVVQVKECTEERYPNGAKKHILIWVCPYYSRWRNMLLRCYSKKFQERRPTYKGCTVCKEWLLFSHFKSWMRTQDWEGTQLDKDLLVEGNKVYSLETCVFVHTKVNSFTTDGGNGRGEHLIGCHLVENDKKFLSRCSSPFTKKKGFLGRFSTELEAHLAWKKQKHIYACQLADSEYVTDERVALALRNKYKNYTILEDHIK
jgi:hypothetical protein